MTEKKLQEDEWKDNSIRIEFVRSWREEEIMELYRAAGWWKEEMDLTRINDLIKGSFLFAVAIDISTGRAVGMGRMISDGIADGYIQDLVVQSDRRSWGVGTMIVARLLMECKKRKITWIGLIAKPGKEDFYRSLGFLPMQGHVPMLFNEEEKDAERC